MTDLTPLFNQCVDIIQSEPKNKVYLQQLKTEKNHKLDHEPPYIVKDTFIKECIELYDTLSSLTQFIIEIQKEYLSISETQSNSQLKNKIDEDFNFKIQQCFKKISFLENYEKKRIELVTSNISKKKNWFFGSNEEQEQYFKTISEHRSTVIKFLSESLFNISKKFEKIQRKRQLREKQLNSLNFQNLEDDDEFIIEDNQFIKLDEINQKFEIENDNENEYPQQQQQQQQQLNSEQIQQLESENQEFLNYKTSQLKKVDNIQQSILDIINIQNELSFKIQEQGETIDNLLDTHSQVEYEVKQGNKTLNQATKKNKRGSNYIVLLCISLGCLIVIFDFLKFI
ncbi:UFE1 [Candida pseudojiufengensis]|uniref:UFE1 n=1 Tax=Candida pseudojiufengensis TaxID=497109 RepID=UPI002223FC7A|nr:UFE1 [Candida pseudojiufengensis]KAI5959882.1 UFE1 [Candida pseudojiufengensis]